MTAMHSYHHLLPSTQYGGAAAVAFRLALDAERRGGADAHVWLPGPGCAWQLANEHKLKVQAYLQPDIVHGSRVSSAIANWRTGRHLRKFSPGVLHVHSAELYGGLPWACALAGMQRIVHIHLEQQPQTVGWAFRRLPDLVITCAEYLVENVRQALPADAQDRLPIVAVPNAVDVDQYLPPVDKRAAKEAVGAAADVPLALMLANLAPHKGQETAIRAVAALRDANLRGELWLAGIDREPGTPFETQLRRLVDELRLHDRVQFLGQRTDSPQLLRAADLFLLPSTREGLPLSLLEAQASGVPVLAAPTPGAAEVVADGTTGYLIPADDPVAYAERMRQLIENPTRGAAVADAAIARVRLEYSATRYCDRIWTLYEQLLSRGRGSQSRLAAML